MYKSKHITVLILSIAALVLAAMPLAAQDAPNDLPPVDERPTLGISFMDGEDGVAVITQVRPDGPAATAGLQADDIITAIDGEAITAETLASTIWTYTPGDEITMTITRDGESLDLSVTLGEPIPQREGERRRQPDFRFERGTMQPFLGIGMNEADAGVTIDEVAEGSAAADAGLQVGDIITAIDDTEINTPQDVIDTIATYTPGVTITLTVMRDGETLEVTATLGSRMNRPMIFEMNGDSFAFDAESNTWQVLEINPASLAADAGLQAGDVITAVNGEPFTADAFTELLGEMNPENTITLTVEREDETLEIEAPSPILLSLFTAAQGPEFLFEEGRPPFEFEFRGPDEGRRDGPFDFRGPDANRFDFEIPPGNRIQLGVAFTTLDADIAAENDLEITEGALIDDVLENTPAADAGLQVGDIIIAVDGDAVDAERTLPDRLFAYEPGDTITLEVVRGDETLEIDVTLDAVPPFHHRELPPAPPAFPGGEEQDS